MREAREAAIWSKALKRPDDDRFGSVVAHGVKVDLASPCIVLGGLNGVGKTRLLIDLKEQLVGDAIIVRLHSLCEEILRFLRSRAGDDIAEMALEYEPIVIDDLVDDVKRIVNREYSDVSWYALEFASSEMFSEETLELLRENDQVLVPFFEVSHLGRSYDALHMGLGELSVHLLYWLLWKLRERQGVVLLLDEPDAFLPPNGSGSLVLRVLGRVNAKDWRLVVSTHSEEIVRLAVEHDGFTYLYLNEKGETCATHVSEDRDVARYLVPSHVSATLFVEDESAKAQLQGILEFSAPDLFGRCTIVWGGGEGYLRKLHEKVPRAPRPESKFVFVLDGDQEDRASEGRWPLIRLPGDEDPDVAFKDLRFSPDQLADAICVGKEPLQMFLGTIEGRNAHDWVNLLGDRFGRPVVLRALALCWAKSNTAHSAEFCHKLRSLLEMER